MGDSHFSLLKRNKRVNIQHFAKFETVWRNRFRATPNSDPPWGGSESACLPVIGHLFGTIKVKSKIPIKIGSKTNVSHLRNRVWVPTNLILFRQHFFYTNFNIYEINTLNPFHSATAILREGRGRASKFHSQLPLTP